jgi:16S rRNA (guanine527-N7)-methyltransferase
VDDPELREVLEESRARGFLGPGPIDRQVQHALDLAAIVGSPTGPFLDLGSGGGLPGLVLAMAWPDAPGTLLDSQRRRCTFLREAVVWLGFGPRITVACGRAERLAREAELRASFDVVLARSFGPPPATAECAVGFLEQGGRLVVTEPPGAEEVRTAERWPIDGLQTLGFSPAVSAVVGDTSAVVMELQRSLEDRWPRRDGVPTKRPLW